MAVDRIEQATALTIGFEHSDNGETVATRRQLNSIDPDCTDQVLADVADAYADLQTYTKAYAQRTDKCKLRVSA